MVSTAQQRLNEARASLFAAESEIVAENAAALELRLTDAIAEGRNLDEQIAAEGRSLVAARLHAESLWGKRALTSAALSDLDDSLTEFPLPAELAAYEQKRAALTEEFHRLSREISDASIPVAQGTNAIQQLTFLRHRARVGIGDLRLAVRKSRGM